VGTAIFRFLFCFFLIPLFLLCICAAYFSFWPVPISPASWQAPKDNGLVGSFKQNEKLKALRHISMADDYGPEDLAVSASGIIAVSSHSGNILRKRPSDTQFEVWVNTGGRPLGLEYDSDDNLFVADAHRGLLKIDIAGTVSVLVDKVEDGGKDTAVVFADDVDIADNGMVYFTDATSKFAAQEYGGTLKASMLEIMEHRGNGRLIEYNPVTEVASVIMDALVFANGVATSKNGDSVLVNETGKYRILRYWLKGINKGRVTVFMDNLPGFPDNISTTKEGDYWLGFAAPRNSMIDKLSASPFLRKAVMRLPAALSPRAEALGHVIKVSSTGEVLQSLQSADGGYAFTTGALQTADGLYISSLTEPFIGFIPSAELPFKGSE
jgi:sugar lactone lactonase YvrE